MPNAAPSSDLLSLKAKQLQTQAERQETLQRVSGEKWDRLIEAATAVRWAVLDLEKIVSSSNTDTPQETAVLNQFATHLLDFAAKSKDTNAETRWKDIENGKWWEHCRSTFSRLNDDEFEVVYGFASLLLAGAMKGGNIAEEISRIWGWRLHRITTLNLSLQFIGIMMNEIPPNVGHIPPPATKNTSKIKERNQWIYEQATTLDDEGELRQWKRIESELNRISKARGWRKSLSSINAVIKAAKSHQLKYKLPDIPPRHGE